MVQALVNRTESLKIFWKRPGMDGNGSTSSKADPAAHFKHPLRKLLILGLAGIVRQIGP
jgi:hypothetical protein